MSAEDLAFLSIYELSYHLERSQFFSGEPRECVGNAWGLTVHTLEGYGIVHAAVFARGEDNGTGLW